MVNVWYAGALLSALAGLATADTCVDESETPAPTTTTTTTTTPSTLTPLATNRTLIVGHRGSPGYLPDHTLEGYTLAIQTGVDVIEPDLVSTKDGVLVCRHEPNIVATTNVADHLEFADRLKNVTLDGILTEGYWVSDFTLAEIKTLRAIQPLSERDQGYNGQFEIPTFDEVIALAQNMAVQVGRTVAIYPETKHPTYHKELGLPLEDKMLAALDAVGWNHADAPVFIQSFEQSNLKELKEKTNITLVQLIDGAGSDPVTGEVVFEAPSDRPYDWTVAGRTDYFGYLVTPEGLAEVATYASIVSPWKRYFLKATAAELDADGNVVDYNNDGKISDADYFVHEYQKLIDDAHAAGLKVHTWTMRDEAYRLAANYSSDPVQEYFELFNMGVDGVFSDDCKTSVPALQEWLASQ
jgi:glycerophosphoryl diester phosphodiesterase